MPTSLQKAVVIELLNVMKAEEGQKKMIFGKPFHYAGSKWVPDKEGPKKDTPKERSSGKGESGKVPGKSVRGERGHEFIYQDMADIPEYTPEIVKDLMNCAEKTKNSITPEKAKECLDASLAWSQQPSVFRSIQQGNYDGSELSERKGKESIDRVEELFNFYPVYENKNAGSKVYRGIALDLNEGWSPLEVKSAFKKGHTIDMKGLSSWSSDEIKAKEFSIKAGAVSAAESISVLFESVNKSGISLTSMSSYPDENEVLHSSKTKWKVKNLISTGKNKFKIQLEEV